MGKLRGLRLSIIGAGFILAQVACQPVFAKTEWSFRPDTSLTAGPPVIWPWGQEISFPWNTVGGVWASGSGANVVYYSFQVIRQSADGGRSLDITAYSPKSCQVLARGKGDLQKRVVKALMESSSGSFEMSIHAFDFNQVSCVPGFGLTSKAQDDSMGSDVVMVMRVYPLNSEFKSTLDFQLQRVDSDPTPICE